MSAAPPPSPPAGECFNIQVTLQGLEGTAQFAGALAAALAPGDLLVLTGGLGAGKTTFTQSLGAALGVTGRISSPTFILSRVHRSAGEGPDLVHVDAYRTDSEGLESLDLLSSLPEAITVIEWGRGLVEEPLLGEQGSWLDLELIRDETTPGSAAGAAEGTGPSEGQLITDFSETEADVLGSRRTAVLRGYGPRWAQAPQL